MNKYYVWSYHNSTSHDCKEPFEDREAAIKDAEKNAKAANARIICIEKIKTKDLLADADEDLINFILAGVEGANPYHGFCTAEPKKKKGATEALKKAIHTWFNRYIKYEAFQIVEESTIDLSIKGGNCKRCGKVIKKEITTSVGHCGCSTHHYNKYDREWGVI